MPNAKIEKELKSKDKELDKTIGDYELLIGIKADKYDLNIIQSNLLTLIMDKSKVI